MTSAIFGRGLPLTEEEFLALGECPERVELFDGGLLVTPAPTPLHQYISRKLANALDVSTPGLYVVEAVNVRLQPGRIPIPDIVVVTAAIDLKTPIIDADVVELVCEIVSPSNAAADKVLKMHHYAVAGIPWYLLVEQETGALHLYRLAGSHYVEHSVTYPGTLLRLKEPVEATIAPEDLLPPGQVDS
jgi:Uma2 family endonuclease